MTSSKKFNKNTKNKKKEKILNHQLLSKIKNQGLIKNSQRKKRLDLEPITMGKKIIGIRELTIFSLQIFETIKIKGFF